MALLLCELAAGLLTCFVLFWFGSIGNLITDVGKSKLKAAAGKAGCKLDV